MASIRGETDAASHGAKEATDLLTTWRLLLETLRELKSESDKVEGKMDSTTTTSPVEKGTVGESSAKSDNLTGKLASIVRSKKKLAKPVCLPELSSLGTYVSLAEQLKMAEKFTPYKLLWQQSQEAKEKYATPKVGACSSPSSPDSSESEETEDEQMQDQQMQDQQIQDPLYQRVMGRMILGRVLLRC